MPRATATLSMFIAFLASASTALAQQQMTEEEMEAACATCGGCGLIALVVLVVLLALNIALLVWVARDAKNRGMDSSVLWMFLVMFTGPIGLLIYIFARPQGQLTQCPHCQNKRLQASVKCPHCGNA